MAMWSGQFAHAAALLDEVARDRDAGPGLAAQALAHRALALWQLGKQDVAAHLARQCIAECDRAQSPMAGHLHRLLMPVLEPPTNRIGAPAKAWQRLSPREQQVAELVAQGLPSRRVARSLEISIRTADCHTGRILMKLGVGSRTELASWLGTYGTLVRRADLPMAS